MSRAAGAYRDSGHFVRNTFSLWWFVFTGVVTLWLIQIQKKTQIPYSQPNNAVFQDFPHTVVELELVSLCCVAFTFICFHHIVELTVGPFFQMRSVDRVFKFIDLPSEELLPGKPGKGRPDLIIDNPHAQDFWPNRGQMDVQGLSVKYTEAGRAVLSDISFSVEGGLSVSLERQMNL